MAAGRDLGLAAELAGIAEGLGYSSIWTNDTPSGDGPANAAAMAGATGSISIGIGALPCDRWNAGQIAFRLQGLGVDLRRLIIVIGAGRAASPLKTLSTTVDDLRAQLGPPVKIGVAALGPRMCRLAGRIAELALLNWSTPQMIEASVGQMRSPAAPEQTPEVAAYVRVALGAGAEQLLEQEASHYFSAPHYRRHFAAMGGPPGLAAAFPEELPGLIGPYEEVLDHTIIRAVPETRSLEAFYAIAEAAAPPSR